MKLRSLLHRKHADQVPLLPSIEPEDGPPPARGTSSRPSLAREERLERLLTPTELDLVLRHRL